MELEIARCLILIYAGSHTRFPTLSRWLEMPKCINMFLWVQIKTNTRFGFLALAEKRFVQAGWFFDRARNT